MLQRGFGQVFECVDLRMQLGFHLGVVGQQEPGPVEHAGGGLVTGDQQRGDLIDGLAIGHAFAGVLVTRLQQHR